MNETIELDQHFGVPGKSKYNFDKLKVGQALKFSDLTKHIALRSAASKQGKALKKKFSVKLITEDDKRTGTKVHKIAVVRVK